MNGTTAPMKSSLWNVAARVGGFETITVSRINSKWVVKGQLHDDDYEILRTMRNDIREFASLGTVARYLADLGVSRFEVRQTPSRDLLEGQQDARQ